MIKNYFSALLLITVLMGAVSCKRMKLASQAVGYDYFQQERPIETTNVRVPAGYKVEPVATNLTYPTAAAVDEEGNLYVVEAGYSYGEDVETPALLRVEKNGKHTIIYEGEENGPWNGVIYDQGFFYIAEGGRANGGRILKVSKAGEVTALVEGIPSKGDHQTNGPVMGPDGYLYFAVGTATNSSVVGIDNYMTGWLPKHNDFHDVPCDDVVLTGKNYTTLNVITPDPNDKATTGSYVPFGVKVSEGQVIPGQIPCSGAIFRIRPTGGEPELLAWGFRNPFGLAFSQDGRLFITENSYDARGSRPVVTRGDHLWELQPNLWYGWPDFEGGVPLYSEVYARPGEDGVERILKEHPNNPPRPKVIFPIHSSADGIAFSKNTEFGYPGEAFVALFGSMTPLTGTVNAPTGFKVVRVNVETGEINDFLANNFTGDPGMNIEKGGLQRPISVTFSPDGGEMYVVDFGILAVNGMGFLPKEKSGVVWKITRQ